MKKQEIGLNAGRIWQLLSNKGPLTIEQIKKEIHLSQNEVMLSIGWLARESKIYCCENNNGTIISLCDCNFYF